MVTILHVVGFGLRPHHSPLPIVASTQRCFEKRMEFPMRLLLLSLLLTFDVIIIIIFMIIGATLASFQARFRS